MPTSENSFLKAALNVFAAEGQTLDDPK